MKHFSRTSHTMGRCFTWLGRGGLATYLAAGAGILLVLLAWHFFRTKPSNNQTLRWGGDKAGGAPYIMEEGGRLTGFEFDLAAYLANKLGLPAEFVPRDWEYLPQTLERGDIDIILNGYEWSPKREQSMASTIPYYIYRLQLVVGPNSTIRNWQDLRGKRVGVLTNSAAHNYLKKTFGNNIEIVALGDEGSTGVLSLVKEGKQLDATVQDLVAIIYYVKQNHGFGDLRLVGEPIEPGYFVIYLDKKQVKLRDQLNDALRAGIQDGTLKAIYEKYGLWNEDQKDLEKTAIDWPPRADESTPGIGASPAELTGFLLLLSRSALTTIVLACLSMPLAMLLGLLVAVGRLYGPRWLDWMLGFYVELLRGTPLLMQLFVIFYMLPALGLTLYPFPAGILGLAINYSAYEAENYRAGLMAIPRGQMEAALSLGMSVRTALWRIIVPQAVRIVIPPITNDFIALFKDTSVVSVIGVLELTGQYRGLMVDDPKYVVHLGVMTASLYLLMSYPLSMLARWLERRFPRVVI